MFRPTIGRLVFVLVLGLGVTLASAAELRLARYFGDRMVLQRDQPIVVYGQADAGATVTVTFGDQSATGKADQTGAWAATLKAMPANGKGQPLKVQASGAKAIELSDVVIGDVILYARQTTIDVSLGKERAASYKPNGKFRAISIKTTAAKQPRADLDENATAGWGVVDANTAARMSAAAFYVGRDLAGELDVPVGMVDLNMGVYFGIGWLSDQAIQASANQLDDKEIRWLREWMRERADQRDDGTAQQELDEYYQQQIDKARGKPVGAKPSLGIHPIKNPMYPSGGFNAVIHPLRHVEFRSVLLQIGADYPYIPYRRLAEEGLALDKPELNQAWYQNYMIMKVGFRSTEKTLPHIIRDWRRAFGNDELPIGLVAPPSSDLNALAKHNREMRELHRRMALDNANTNVILPEMDNVDFSGQPANEQALAQRCRQWLLGDVYGKDVVATGPVIDRVDAYLGNATIHFKKGTADGLKAVGQILEQFEVAAPGGDFMLAKAWVDGSTIKLHSDEVGQIKYVRFNWNTDPQPGLVNSAELPAMPFNTDDRWTFRWFYRDKDTELPEEYFTTADTWGESDVAIINGEIDYLASGDSERIPRRPGPIGIYSSPFGPNIYVISIDEGTPAVGKLMPGDFIYGVNGEKFTAPDDPMYKQLAAAITYSESEAGGGKLNLMVRRGKKLIEVALDMPIMGTYSPTSPYYCEKTNRIIERAKQWSARQFRPDAGRATNPEGFLGTDIWFLLATGDPEVQGLVRRAVYEHIAKKREEPDPHKRAHNWSIGYEAILLGEYYHATGDRNVLPALENLAGWAAVTQIKKAGPEPVPWEVAQADEHVGGYRQRYNPTGKDRWKSGYGLMPPAGTACIKGMIYANEAGLDIDQAALQRGIRHFKYKRAEHAFVEYLYWNLRREGPPKINPEAEAQGKLSSLNGKNSQAAALFRLLDDQRVVEICSRYSVYAYNNTRYGHGGMFFNNFWTPIGAHAAGKAGFQHFMQGQTWWRELYRRSDGSFNQVGRGGIGVGYAIHYVAPRKRLRILGAPHTAFGTAGKDVAYLQPALQAHRDRDYAKCEEIITKVLDAGTVPAAELPMLEHFLESVRILRASIEHDLSYVEKQITAGNYDYAAMELSQLKGVVAPDNPRLVAIVEKLESDDVTQAMRKLASQRQEEDQQIAEALREALPAEREETWVSLTPWPGDDLAKGKEPAKWKMKLVEDRVQAPENWDEPGFDDATWDETTLPISWAMYHSVLFRTKVNIDDPSKFDGVRFRGCFFQQGNVMIYINGELVAKVDNIGRGNGMTDSKLTSYAVDLLKKGENTIAVTTRHKRRWGPLRGKYTTVSNDGFGIMIDARLKQ